MTEEFLKYSKAEKIEEFLASEPEVLEILRLIYWYYKCSTLSSTFNCKKSEIRDKINKGLLDLLTPYYSTIAYDKVHDHEFNSWIREKLRETTPVRGKDIRYQKSVLEILRVIKSINSELMIAYLSNTDTIKISFARAAANENESDYDFIINDRIGTQVKTLFPQDSNEEFFYKVSKLEINETIDYSRLEEEFRKYFLDTNLIDKINKSIEQNAKLLFFNLSYTYVGFAFERYLVESGKRTSLQKCLYYSIRELSENKFLPLVVYLSRVNIKHSLEFIYLKVPIKIEHDKMVLDRASIQGYR